ncbi:MAG: hypothetical protein ACOC4G_01040 [Bacillota bacterium]
MFLFLDSKKIFTGRITIFKIAATFIGTIIGAGFASGQEVLQFFGYYHFRGFFGIIITALLFIIYGYIILKLGWKYRAYSHKDILKKLPGQMLIKLLDLIIIFFLFGAFITMIAGSGAIFAEQFLLNSIWGNLFMVLISLLTVILGVSGVVTAISGIVPFLITGIIFLAVVTFFNQSFPDTGEFIGTLTVNSPLNNWFTSAMVYVSYNIVMAIAILAPLGGEVDREEILKPGSILGGLGLGMGAGLILFTLLYNLPEILEYEIPMIYVAGEISPWIRLSYSFILLAEIYTTAVGNLFGFVRRISGDNKKRYKIVSIISCILALFFSQAGFSTLVYYLYPVIGYTGFLILAGLTLTYFME